MSKLWVAFTSDTEDNHPAYVPGWEHIGSNYDARRSVLKWEWTRYFTDLSRLFRDRDIPVTWLVRVDNGPVWDRMLELFKNEILELKSQGDEIGIHIHTFTWNQEYSKWVQTTDSKHESRIVQDSLDFFKKRLGFSPLCNRMGWCTMSNDIMRMLDARGLLVDSSAIPGTSCSGKFGKRDNIYDWSKTPNVPYHPSYDDFQSPGNLRILELPISTLDGNTRKPFASLVNNLSGMRGLVKLLPLARRLRLTPHHSFYITPWWDSSIYDTIIEAYCNKAYISGTAFLVGSFHACDILDPKTGKKNKFFEQCLSRIIRKILSHEEFDVRFATLSEIAKRYDTMMDDHALTD